jgi:hypothetical protein
MNKKGYLKLLFVHRRKIHNSHQAIDQPLSCQGGGSDD